MDKKKNAPKAKEEREERVNADTAETVESINEPLESIENTSDEGSGEIQKYNARILELEAQLEDAVSTAQRLQAEFDNFRKRNARLRAESIEEGTENTIKGLLETLDSFERALESQSTSTDDAFFKGMELVYKQMVDALHKQGLNEIEADGAFDPSLHEAIMQDDSGEYESGTITAVLQKGYKVNNRIIRHTLVKVAK